MALVVYETMAPKAQDPSQVLLCKAAYYLQAAAESLSVDTPSAMYENMTPFAQDPSQVLLAKLAYWASQVAGGGGGGGGSGGTAATTNMALSGSEPPTDGSVSTFNVFDTDTGFKWYNSGTIGSPTWHNV